MCRIFTACLLLFVECLVFDASFVEPIYSTPKLSEWTAKQATPSDIGNYLIEVSQLVSQLEQINVPMFLNEQGTRNTFRLDFFENSQRYLKNFVESLLVDNKLFSEYKPAQDEHWCYDQYKKRADESFNLKLKLSSLILKHLDIGIANPPQYNDDLKSARSYLESSLNYINWMNRYMENILQRIKTKPTDLHVENIYNVSTAILFISEYTLDLDTKTLLDFEKDPYSCYNWYGSNVLYLQRKQITEFNGYLKSIMESLFKPQESKSSTRPVNKPQDRSTQPVNKPQDKSTPLVKKPQDKSTPLVKKPQDKSTPPVKNSQDKSTPPVKKPQDKSTPPVKNSQDKLTPPVKKPQDKSTTPVNKPKVFNSSTRAVIYSSELIFVMLISNLVFVFSQFPI